jgi:ADP-ribose pyrophosphatase YjhB (NUDIX family)
VTEAIPIHNAWQFCPRCGADSGQVGQQPFRCPVPDCRYTHYFSPNTAVGALIVDTAGDMLFIVRGKNPGKGKLGLPGGFVDAGETAEESLVREVEEELNLVVLEYQYLASFPNKYSFSGVVTPVTDLFYVAWVETLEGMKAQAGEVDGWSFLPIEKVAAADLAFDTHRLALQAFMALNAEE